MPTVTHTVSENGDHAIGVTVDDVFVPFVSLAPETVARLVAQGEHDAPAVEPDAKKKAV